MRGRWKTGKGKGRERKTERVLLIFFFFFFVEFPRFPYTCTLAFVELPFLHSEGDALYLSQMDIVVLQKPDFLRPRNSQRVQKEVNEVWEQNGSA